MKILREQFKNIENNYNKNSKNNFINDKRFKISIVNRNSDLSSLNYGNSMSNMSNLHGSYIMQNNNSNNNNHLNDNINNDMFIEEYNIIISLWEDLGVTDNYKLIFENLSKDIDPVMRKDLFESEISSLKKFSDLLFKLSKEVENREQLIIKIHVINDSFISILEKKEEILLELILNLKSIRITSLNIVNYLQKIRESCSYNVLGGKHNLDKINKMYKFDKNYMIKMKFDIDFLKNSKLAAFFEFEPFETDPFLLYFSFKNESLEKKYSMKIPEEMLNSVKQAQFLILQDLIFFNINSIYMKNLQEEKNLGKLKGIYGRDFSNPNKNKKFVSVSSRLYSPRKRENYDNEENNYNKNNYNKNYKNRPSTSYNNVGTSRSPLKNSSNVNGLNSAHKRQQESQINSNDVINLNNKKPQNNTKIELIEVNKKNDIEKDLPKQGEKTNQNKENVNDIVNMNENNNNNNNQTQNQAGNNNMSNMNMFQNMGFNPFLLMNNFNNVNSMNNSSNNNVSDPNNQMNFYLQNALSFNPFLNPYASLAAMNPNLMQMAYPMLFQNQSNPNVNLPNNFFNLNGLVNNNIDKNNLINEDKKQNLNKSIKDNSKIIKTKTQEIIAIDKKDKKSKEKKKDKKKKKKKDKKKESDDSSSSFSSKEKNKKEIMNKSFSADSSSFTKKLEEELSLSNEIEHKNTKKSNKNNKQIFKKTESDIHEENSYTKGEDGDYNKSYNLKENDGDEFSKIKNINKNDKGNFDNNYNISENYSYKSEKKNENNEFKNKGNNNYMNKFNENKENSIDEIIDSRSIKEIENEINSDFKNDLPAIEESKKSIKELSPRNLNTHSSRFGSEKKFEKLEIINEESVDKSKSNIKEFNQMKNKDLKTSKIETLKNSEIEEDYENYGFDKKDENHNKGEIKISQSNRSINKIENSQQSKNMSRNKIENNIIYNNKEYLAENMHETFDSLKTNTVKSNKFDNEFTDQKSNPKNIRNLGDIIKTEENYDFENKNNYNEMDFLNNKSRKSKTSQIEKNEEIPYDNDFEDNMQEDKNYSQIKNKSKISEQNYNKDYNKDKSEIINMNHKEHSIQEEGINENDNYSLKGSLTSIQNKNFVAEFIVNEDLNNFDFIYKSYKENLNSEQKITFKPKESIIDYLNYFNPKIIKLKNTEKEVIGLCCVSYDNNFEDSIKLEINHISVLNFEIFDELVGILLNFIKENIPAEEIIIELHYEVKDDNFEVNKYIRDIFKEKFNFKWHKLENKNGEISQKMSLEIKNRINKNNKNDIIKLINSVVEVNYFLVVNFVNQDSIKNATYPNINNNEIQNLNYFSIVSSLCQMQNINTNIVSEMLEKYDKEKIKRSCRNFITLFDQENYIDYENYEKIKDYLPESIVNMFSQENESRKILSIMKLNIKFSNFSTYRYNKLIYNRIQGSISTLIHEQLNHKFHVILSADCKYTMLVSEYNCNLKEYLIENKNKNLYKLFDDLYNNLQNPISEHESPTLITNQSIWIPAFVDKKQINLDIENVNEEQINDENNFSLIEDVKNIELEILDKGEKNNIHNVFQCYNSLFRFDKHYKNNPILKPLVNEIVINDSYLISIINLDVLADSHISTVFLSIIDKDLWINDE